MNSLICFSFILDVEEVRTEVDKEGSLDDIA